MPRRARVFVEGATYHVYARVTRREGIFAEPQEAGAWIDAVREAKRRDGFAVLAWCLMSNHFHLLLRTASVPLWRSMRSIQGRFAAGFNRRRRLVGPVWQSRYKAKIVQGDRYLRQVVAYIHLNPVKAGVVEGPEEYRLGGHRELVGKAAARVADPDETLRLFGDTRRAALRTYRATVRAVLEQLASDTRPSAVEEAVGAPAVELIPRTRVPGLDPLGASPGPSRPVLDAAAFIERACAALGCDAELLRSRRQDAGVTRLREAILLVGTERYGLRVKALAAAMGKTPDAASRWVGRGAERRRTDTSFAELVARLDAALASRERPDGQE